MPATTRYSGTIYASDGTYTSAPPDQRYTTTVTCGRCNESRTFSHPNRRPPLLADMHAWLRYLPGPGRYHSRCRSCETAERRERVAANGGQNATAPVNTDRRFGVELELMFPNTRTAAGIAAALTDAGIEAGTGGFTSAAIWRVKSDGSLNGRGLQGWEIVSPPLSGPEGLAQVRKVCEVLEGIGAKANHSCGLHVHHEIRDLKPLAIKRLVSSWANNQDLIDGLVAPSRRRGARHQYVGAFRPEELAHIESLRTFTGYVSGVPRYRNLNLNAFGRYGTIEVRQHQGTVNGEKICSWILFGQALIASSRREALPAAESVRDLLVEKMARTLDATARTFLLGRAVEFGHARVA